VEKTTVTRELPLELDATRLHKTDKPKDSAAAEALYVTSSSSAALSVSLSVNT